MVRSERVFERHVSLARGWTPSDVGWIDGFADLARDGVLYAEQKTLIRKSVFPYQSSHW
jgi:hypothetical protein